MIKTVNRLIFLLRTEYRDQKLIRPMSLQLYKNYLDFLGDAFY